MSSENYEQILDLAMRVSRSTIAIVDAVIARGAIKGEEASTIGQLRDSSVTLAQLVENEQSATSEFADPE